MNSDSLGKTIFYWITTILVCLVLIAGGIGELLRPPQTVAGMAKLGYPSYLMLILGTWKLLGAIALLAPGLGRLKEWAYAGIFFDLTGASISHAISHDVVWHIFVPLIILVISMISWALRPRSRMIGTLCKGGSSATDQVQTA